MLRLDTHSDAPLLVLLVELRGLRWLLSGIQDHYSHNPDMVREFAGNVFRHAQGDHEEHREAALYVSVELAKKCKDLRPITVKGLLPVFNVEPRDPQSQLLLLASFKVCSSHLGSLDVEFVKKFVILAGLVPTRQRKPIRQAIFRAVAAVLQASDPSRFASVGPLLQTLPQEEVQELLVILGLAH